MEINPFCLTSQRWIKLCSAKSFGFSWRESISQVQIIMIIIQSSAPDSLTLGKLCPICFQFWVCEVEIIVAALPGWDFKMSLNEWVCAPQKTQMHLLDSIRINVCSFKSPGHGSWPLSFGQFWECYWYLEILMKLKTTVKTVNAEIKSNAFKRSIVWTFVQANTNNSLHIFYNHLGSTVTMPILQKEKLSPRAHSSTQLPQVMQPLWEHLSLILHGGHCAKCQEQNTEHRKRT